jgi:hypothetical protein
MPMEVWSPRWSQSLRRMFSTKTGGASVLTVLDDVLPVMPLADPAEVEAHYNRGEYVWSTGMNVVAAGVTQAQAFVGLAQSQGPSSGLMVLEKCTISGSTAAGPYSLAIRSTLTAQGLPAPANVANVYPMDSRYLGAIPAAFNILTQPTITAGWINTAVGWSTDGVVSMAYASALGVAEVLLDKDSAMVLGPGFYVAVSPAVVNVGFDVTFSGYWKPLEAGE